MDTSRRRENPRPLPPSLGRRHLPKLGIETLVERSASYRTLEAVITRPGPRRPKIVSTAHGPIKHLLLCYPAYADGEYSYRNVYADLFRKLPETTKFTILTHPNVTSDLEEALGSADAGSRATIVEAPDYLHFLVWAEDPYIVVHDVSADPPTLFFIEPYTFTRVSDAAIADYVAEATALQSIQSPLYFQGGNVLIGDDFVLIGADYPANTLQLIERNRHILVPEGADRAGFVKDLYQKTFDPERRVLYAGTKLPVPEERRRSFRKDGEQWTEEIYLGTGRAQPIFHIDMFITLVGRGPSGKYRVLVGSPAEADRVLSRPPVPHAMSEIFDDVARNLEHEGFEVLRNPLPLTYVDYADSRVRAWYFATANNCLVQIDETSGNIVWLPTYGHGDWADLSAVDDENKRIWEDLGFEVQQLADFNPFAQNLGSIHCIKKYLER